MVRKSNRTEPKPNFSPKPNQNRQTSATVKL